jgi:glucose/arabinose dehydrogenase
VIVRSSGGALTSGGDDLAPATDDDQAEDEGQEGTKETAEPEQPTGSEEVPVVPTETKARSAGGSDTKQGTSPAADVTAGTIATHATGQQTRFSRSAAAAQLTTPEAPANEGADLTNQAVANAFTNLSTPTSDAPEEIAPALAPSTFISVARNLISAALSPFLAPDPTTTPPESPLLWAVLGWVRRQFTRPLEDSAPAADVVLTSQTEALAAEDVTAQAGLPSDLERTVLVSGLDSPTDLAFLPDGSLLIAQQNGTIRLYHDGHLHDTPVAVLNANSEGERGLLGIEVDPAFDENGDGYIYVSYTSAETNYDRLSRFTVTNYVADPDSELVLIESDEAANTTHHGGEVSFDLNKEHLYWSVGDNIFAPNAQDLSNIHGKVLRINPDGSIPEDNPFLNTPGARPEIYAYGFRNPFRFTFAPDGTPQGALLVGDVGSASWEELNVVTAGANYGWPDAEGTCDGCGFVNPIYVYPHTSGVPQQGSITSVLFYTGDALGPEYKNKVFIADYAVGWMKVLSFDPKFESFIGETMFDDQAGTTVKLVQGPDEKIYQLTIYPGELSVIAPSGGNRAPTAVVTATPSNGLGPLEVQFSGEDSTDPDPNTTLTYEWDFGDASPSSTAVNPTHTYSANGTYDVTLTVSDGEKTNTATQRITVGNRAPVAVINLPADGALYSAGDTINFNAQGSSDPDGDPLTYEWKVVFHHEEHVHPFEDGIVGQSGSVVIPRSAENLPTTWYRIELTVTDDHGLSSSTYVDVKPRLVNLTFDPGDPNATITIDGVPHKGAYTETAVVGVERTISAPSQVVNGQELEFSHWSDGRPQTHVITTPATDTTYRAIFDVVNTEPIPRFAILKQIVQNQVANFQRLVDAFGSGGVVDAVKDIASTTLARATGVATAIVSNGSDLVLAVLKAPAEVGGTLVTTANRLVAALSDFDPLGVLGAVQTGAVAFSGEISHQINVIDRAVHDTRAAVLAAVSVPLPTAASALSLAGSTAPTANVVQSPNLLVNPSAELGDPSLSGHSSVTVPGWTVTGAAGEEAQIENQRLATTTASIAPTSASIVPDIATLKTCACTVIKQLVDVLGNVLQPILNPPSDPGGTPEPPLLWAVLGFVRREITRVLDLPPVARVVQTVKTSAVQFYQALVTCGQPSQGLPADFERTVLATGLTEPTDFEFLPDGRILITEKSGAIRVFENGQLNVQPLVVLPLAANLTAERGLSGIEVDPHFDDGNPYIYVSYISPENHLRLSRLTVMGDNADLASEIVLVESELESGNIHHGGELAFGPDGMLYWSIGENGFNPNAQDLTNLHGKVLRVNPYVLNADGTATVPADNPFVETPGAKPQIYAYGFRNPFRFTFTPNGQLLLGDVGDQSWEELNIVTAGANYGWPGAEGVCTGCEFVNPVYAYEHTPPPSRAASLTSVLVYTGETFGESYENKVFIADFTLGWIKVLTFDSEFSSVISEETFDNNAGTPVKLVQGPDGNIYQLNIYPGELSVIAPSGGNRAPTAIITATPSNGLSPLQVNFSSNGSGDPDPNTTLTYAWNFGDGNTSTAASPTHTYTTNGAYNVTLTVSDGEKTGQATQRIVVGSTAPTAQILTPINDSLYAAGDTISFSGIGSDAEDGTLPDSAYKWTVVFHHANHIHPFQDNIIGPSGSITIPRDPQNVDTTWYEITLTVTDSSGLSTSQSVAVRPKLVTMTFNANDGAVYTIDGIPHTGSYTEQAVVGVERVLSASSPQVVNGQQLVFDSWSDGGAQTHVITTPGANTSYTVTFVPAIAATLV